MPKPPTTFRKIDPESPTGFAKHKETVTKRHWAVEAGEQLNRYRAAWARIGANALEDAGLPLAAARFRVGHLTLPEQRKAAKERGDMEWFKQLDRMPWVRGGEADGRNFANISIVYDGQIRGVCLSCGRCRRRLLDREDLLRH